MDPGRLIQDTSITSFKTGCPIGILVMVHYIPPTELISIIRKKTLNNQTFFFIAHLGPGPGYRWNKRKQLPRIEIRFDTKGYSHHRQNLLRYFYINMVQNFMRIGNNNFGRYFGGKLRSNHGFGFWTRTPRGKGKPTKPC